MELVQLKHCLRWIAGRLIQEGSYFLDKWREHVRLVSGTGIRLPVMLSVTTDRVASDVSSMYGGTLAYADAYGYVVPSLVTINSDGLTLHLLR